jgi:aspartyl-tRNA(Asn)/glutamyl-tRNA(Gln) amidotransferase subunit A
MSLIEVAGALRSGKLSSVMVTEAALARCTAAQARLNCFLRIDREGALRVAAAADAARASGAELGLLHGVPLAHKDMFNIAGRAISYGSRVRGEYVPRSTATVIERLDAAGAINLGALNMAEFALGPTGHNAIWGDCRNAIDPDYMAGGSSSGSGAAVGSGAVYGALGSDTGGSVRIPAAANGVVGLKPTYGRIPRDGSMKLTPSIDVPGPLTRTVRDCARLLGVLAGHSPRDPLSSRRPLDNYESQLTRGVEGLRVGVPRNYFNESLSEDVRAAMESSLAALQAQGARLVDVQVPAVEAMSELSRAIVYSEATALHAAWLRSRADVYSPQVRVRASTGLAIPASIYLEALMLRMPLLRRFVEEVFSRCDVLHTPTLPVPVPRLADVDLGAGADLWRILSLLVRCTAPVNYLGLPALAVPAARTRNGLRASVQLIGRPFAEAMLLRVAAVHEAALR